MRASRRYRRPTATQRSALPCPHASTCSSDFLDVSSVAYVEHWTQVGGRLGGAGGKAGMEDSREKQVHARQLGAWGSRESVVPPRNLTTLPVFLAVLMHTVLGA